MRRRINIQLLLLVATTVAVTLVPPSGRASGGRYAFDGGTPRQQEAVVRALDASSFDWDLLPARITVHIQRGITSSATPGQVWLDADLLDAGQFAWGVVQHEFAHQVDFFLLTAHDRELLLRELGGTTWCTESPERRDRLGCERFASAIAWSYWPAAENCMRPADASKPAQLRFRRVVSRLIRTDVDRARGR